MRPEQTLGPQSGWGEAERKPPENSSFSSPRLFGGPELAALAHSGHPEPRALSPGLAFREPCWEQTQATLTVLHSPRLSGSIPALSSLSHCFIRSGHFAAIDWHAHTLSPLQHGHPEPFFASARLSTLVRQTCGVPQCSQLLPHCHMATYLEPACTFAGDMSPFAALSHCCARSEVGRGRNVGAPNSAYPVAFALFPFLHQMFRLCLQPSNPP